MHCAQVVVPASPQSQHMLEIHRRRSNSKVYRARLDPYDIQPEVQSRKNSQEAIRIEEEIKLINDVHDTHIYAQPSKLSNRSASKRTSYISAAPDSANESADDLPAIYPFYSEPFNAAPSSSDNGPESPLYAEVHDVKRDTHDSSYIDSDSMYNAIYETIDPKPSKEDRTASFTKEDTSDTQ